MVMNRREFVGHSLAAMALAGLGARSACAADPPAPGPATAPAARPNIIFVVADDMGWADPGYQGNPFAKTPVLDDMASRGVRFDYFYSAQQMCSPGRFGILTGRSPFRTGMFQLSPMRKEEITVAQVLQKAGWRTGHFGKWHLANKDTGEPSPLKMGFDRSVYTHNWFDVGDSLTDLNTGNVLKMEGDSSVYVMQQAMEWMKPLAEKGEPFFAYVCFGSPHLPHKGHETFKKLYDGVKFDDEHLEYYAEVSGIDAAMGQLRENLRRWGVADNTVIWYVSDNGAGCQKIPESFEPNKLAKMDIGARVCALLEWPARFPRPIRTALATVHMDMYPTVLDICGLKAPDDRPLDGVSILPLLEKNQQMRPSPIGFMMLHEEANTRRVDLAKVDFVKEARGVWLDGSLKLFVPMEVLWPLAKSNHPRTTRLSLYDIYKDPAEKNNLAEKMPEEVAAMRKALDAWRLNVRASFDGKDYAK